LSSYSNFYEFDDNLYFSGCFYDPNSNLVGFNTYESVISGVTDNGAVCQTPKSCVNTPYNKVIISVDNVTGLASI
jgi:hypothetical protein